VLARRVVAWAAGTGWVLLASVATAQARKELRLDVLAARDPSVQLGGGVAVPTGTYTRLAIVGAIGTKMVAPRRALGRVDFLARFGLDPFGESRYGLYGFGGVGGWTARDAKPDYGLVVGAGLEGSLARRATLAAEVGLGGGVRIGIVVRSAMRGRR
jgi:hypothetical protein